MKTTVGKRLTISPLSDHPKLMQSVIEPASVYILFPDGSSMCLSSLTPDNIGKHTRLLGDWSGYEEIHGKLTITYDTTSK